MSTLAESTLSLSNVLWWQWALIIFGIILIIISIIPFFNKILSFIVNYMIMPVFITIILFFVAVAIADTYFGMDLWVQIKDFFSNVEVYIQQIV